MATAARADKKRGQEISPPLFWRIVAQHNSPRVRLERSPQPVSIALDTSHSVCLLSQPRDSDVQDRPRLVRECRAQQGFSYGDWYAAMTRLSLQQCACWSSKHVIARDSGK